MKDHQRGAKKNILKIKYWSRSKECVWSLQDYVCKKYFDIDCVDQGAGGQDRHCFSICHLLLLLLLTSTAACPPLVRLAQRVLRRPPGAPRLRPLFLLLRLLKGGQHPTSPTQQSDPLHLFSCRVSVSDVGHWGIRWFSGQLDKVTFKKLNKIWLLNREEEEWEMSQAELSKLIKEEEDWFNWDINDRFNDLYAQVSPMMIDKQEKWNGVYNFVLRTSTKTCRDPSTTICRRGIQRRKLHSDHSENSQCCWFQEEEKWS